jgi:two-component system chemotaxis sensor kinase CheA/two-component system sensor histidine kinase and response regulator WspE
MNERKRALLQKFKATAADRIRRISMALIDLEEGRAEPAAAHDVARELHTLKGESNMLGLAPMGAVAHAAETALGRGHDPQPAACALVRRALAVVQRALDEEPLGADADGSLAAACMELRAFAPTAAPSAPVSSGDAPAPETTRAMTPSDPRGAAAVPPVASTPAPSERWVQIASGRVDGLCEDIAGFTSDFRALSRRLDALFRAVAGPDAAGPRERGSLVAAMRLAAEDLDRCRSRLLDINDAAWALRLSPVDPLLSDLVRHAREIALSLGKRVRVTARSGGAALERALLDELWDPLLHVVRNAVDHGIEAPHERGGKDVEATITISAESAGPSVVLTVEDDGRGIDPDRVRQAAVEKGMLGAEAAAALSEREAIELLFVHGFSTRAEVSELSGRGVGLDVVRRRVEALGGSVEVTSRRGQGTRFSLTIPATISRERTLVVEVGGTLYGIPFRNIGEIVRAAEVPAAGAAGPRGAEPRPLRSLSAALDAPLPADGEPWAVVLETARGPIAFAIPRVVGELDLLRHPLDPVLMSLGYLGASATLDDGRLVLILSVPGLVRRAESRPHAPPAGPRKRPRVLVVEDAPVVRAMLADVLADSGIDVETAGDGEAGLRAIERAEPALVLSDVDMPRMDGLALLRAVRRRPRRVPFVLLTARSSADDRRRAADEGADAFLVKSSFAAATLLETVKRLLPVVS